jgi:hypothetical protein
MLACERAGEHALPELALQIVPGAELLTITEAPHLFGIEATKVKKNALSPAANVVSAAAAFSGRALFAFWTAVGIREALDARMGGGVAIRTPR